MMQFLDFGIAEIISRILIIKIKLFNDLEAIRVNYSQIPTVLVCGTKKQVLLNMYMLYSFLFYFLSFVLA